MAESKKRTEHSGKQHNPKVHKQHAAEEKKPREIRITLPEVKGINWATITTVAAVALLVIVVLQAFQTYTLTKDVDAAAAKAKELSKLPAVQLTVIEADCSECSPIASVVSSVESARVNVTKKETLSSNDATAKQLIANYNIKRLPTVIVTGEIGKASLSGFTQAGDALVYAQTPAPYVDVATGEVKGLVSLTYVNASGCKECPDLLPTVQQLRGSLKIKEFKVVDKDSEEGRKVVEEYEMLRLPGLLLSNDVNEYPIATQLAQVGTVKKGGAIALGANPPYYNASTGKVDGIANLILLNDSGCTGCYDVTMHLAIVKSRFQVYFESIKSVDASSEEGKELVSKYSIKAVPTIILTGEVSAYPQLKAVWPGVGTVESDGAYVFRQMGQIAGSPYKDLATGKVEPNMPKQSG